MTADALASDRLIAMARPEPRPGGGEPAASGIAPLACEGVIEGAARLPDGRYLLRLRGVSRVGIVDFVRQEPYLVARVRVLPDRDEDDGPDVGREKHRLLAACAALRHEIQGRPGQAAAVNERVPFASAVNMLCQTLNMDPATRIGLLRLDDVRERSRVLVHLLDRRWREIATARSAQGLKPDEIH
jgi:Lon protease-like protein